MKTSEIEKIDFDNWPLPNEYLIELGRLSQLWATLESSLLIYIAKLAGYNNLDDLRPHILLTHTSFQQRVEILSSLCDLLEKFRLCKKQVGRVA